jgi:hypothetical protein
MTGSLQKFWRIEVYVPVDGLEHSVGRKSELGANKHVRSVITALENVIGVGRIGNYDKICELSAGWEQYRPTPGALPRFGAIGERVRLATVTVTSYVEYRDNVENLERVVAAVRAVHPWEHPIIQFSECLLYVPEHTV